MKFYKEKIMNMAPDSGKIALFISLLALGLMVGNNNQPCLSAQSTCSVGSDNEFTENIKIKGGTSYATTLDGSGILADRTLTLPDSDLDLNNVIVAGGLSSSKSVSTDGSGDLTTNDVYPLTLTASKILSSSASGNVETTDVYPLSFTASSVVLTDVSGNLTDGTVDVDQLTPGGASTNDEIRMGAGGDWEAYTPAGGGGGRWTLVGEGQMVHYYGDMAICWYDDTQGTGIGGGLDQTKVYKLVVEPINDLGSYGTTNTSYPKMALMQDTDCPNIGSSSDYLFASTVTNNGLSALQTNGWKYSYTGHQNAPWMAYQQAESQNSSSYMCGGSSIEMIIRNGIDLNGGSANTNNEGVKITDMKVSTPCYDVSQVFSGFQEADNAGFFWDSTQSFGSSPVDNMNQMTGIMFKVYDGQAGAGAGTPPVWYLYESTH